MSFTPKNLYPPFDNNSANIEDWTATSDKHLGQTCYTRTGAWQGLANIFYLTTGTYTYSLYYKTAVSMQYGIYPFVNSGFPHENEKAITDPDEESMVNSFIGDNQWHRITFTFTVTQAGYLMLRVERRYDNSNPLIIAAPQLEVGDTATDFEPYNCTWYIGLDGELHNTNFIDLPDTAMSQPYPDALWRITEGVNDGLPYNMLMPDVPAFGAFANATSLAVIHIPRSVKSIGVETFRNTNLISVTIASDCTYYDTSFPEGCVVNFYPD